MGQSTYEIEWERQRARTGLPPNHLAVHRWYLRMDKPWEVADRDPPMEGLTIMRAHDPSVAFYRFLYHTAGEEFVWGDRRRMSDEQLAGLIKDPDVHVMVLYKQGTPAGFFDINFSDPNETEIKYFALLPGFIGGGLGSLPSFSPLFFTPPTVLTESPSLIPPSPPLSSVKTESAS